MPSRVLYIHGAGNRAAQAEAYATKLRAHLGFDTSRLLVSDWGEQTGANLGDIASTIPEIPAGAFGPADEAVLQDPYAPLRAMPAAASGAFAPDHSAEDVLAFIQLSASEIESVGIPSAHLAAAASEVARSPELAAAGGDATDRIDAAVTAAIARSMQRQANPASANAFAFNPIADAKAAVAKLMFGNGPGAAIAGWLGPKLAPPALLWVSKQLAPKRREIMQEHILVVADVLRYQRFGAAMRAHLVHEIKEAGPRPLVLAHSLGGIIAVDALFGAGAPAIDVGMLVTFGSQSAMLKAIDALDPVSVPAGVPWLNIYTRYDFVSFRDEAAFPGAQDREITIDVGFPDAHGAYYDVPEFYSAIREHPVGADLLG